jgi:hypothetical protein
MKRVCRTAMPLEHAQEPIRSSRCTSLHAGDSGNAEIAQGARHHLHMFGDTDLNIGLSWTPTSTQGPGLTASFLATRCRYELPARIRGDQRSGVDDLHRPALRRKIQLELPARKNSVKHRLAGERSQSTLARWASWRRYDTRPATGADVQRQRWPPERRHRRSADL